ncbi:hypothetical protein OUZ56_010974 [Daphnia magna]|uniref:Uncharacterized protein n=1 Tax=Daphnia magna TaxID=35525 RepID=A0ABQ9YYX9_9CRUS|nr:hypothetical protein OUZ56_010974 [Daphnia magna]
MNQGDGDYDVMLLFAFAILMATSAGTDGFVLIWTLDYTTPTPYYTTSYAAPSYSTKALEYYTTYAAPSYYTESSNYLIHDQNAQILHDHILRSNILHSSH